MKLGWVANVKPGHRYLRPGAKVFIFANSTVQDGNDRLHIYSRNKQGRKITCWVSPKALTNVRVRTFVPVDPLYNEIMEVRGPLHKF